MHSPLPDASALENGILEDERPSRFSRVQDNVRQLLRNSMLSSTRGSTLFDPTPTPPPIIDRQVPPLRIDTHVITPQGIHPAQRQPETLPTPVSSIVSSTSTGSGVSPVQSQDATPGVLFPPMVGSRASTQHTSTVFNDRAITALDHPDLSDPSLEILVRERQERRQRALTRSKSESSRRRRKRRRTTGVIICVLSCLLLAAIISCYIAVTVTSGNVAPTFHILFVLGILLATALFVHSLLGLCLRNRKRSNAAHFFILPPPKNRRRHRSPRNGSNGSNTTGSSESAEEYVPPTPIQVHVPSDEVRPDSREAEPTVGVEIPSDSWDKDVRAVMNPPPAYGKWRGSVRANPELLHWQVVPSPVTPDTPSIPSPTYEEAMGARMVGPPSYRTRNSPQRVQDGEARGDHDRQPHANEDEPEMVEGRGIGLTQ